MIILHPCWPGQTQTESSCYSSWIWSLVKKRKQYVCFSENVRLGKDFPPLVDYRQLWYFAYMPRCAADTVIAKVGIHSPSKILFVNNSKLSRGQSTKSGSAYLHFCWRLWSWSNYTSSLLFYVLKNMIFVFFNHTFYIWGGFLVVQTGRRIANTNSWILELKAR